MPLAVIWLSRAHITVGALVAALAAYKDLSSPWKELLTYYNQTQDMSLRWDIVTERFDPSGVIDEALFEGTPDQIPHLRGEIELRNVSVRNTDGNMILQDISLKTATGQSSGHPDGKPGRADGPVGGVDPRGYPRAGQGHDGRA